jgi:Cys-rich protein (TIGR01571 family)
MQALDAKTSAPKVSNAGTMACLCALCLSCVGAGYNRNRLRHAYRIEGYFCLDCLLHWCCGACAVTQEWQHVMLLTYKDAAITICNVPAKE